jgi:TolB-like protein
MAYPLPDKPSIAVLPFDNMSGDSEQEYIADGFTESECQRKIDPLRQPNFDPFFV